MFWYNKHRQHRSNLIRLHLSPYQDSTVQYSTVQCNALRELSFRFLYFSSAKEDVEKQKIIEEGRGKNKVMIKLLNILTLE